MNLRNSVVSILAAEVATLSITDLCVLASTHGRDADAIRELIKRGRKGMQALAATIGVLYLDGPRAKEGTQGKARKAAEHGNKGLSLYAATKRAAHDAASPFTVARNGDTFECADRVAKRARVANEKNAKSPSADAQFAKKFRALAGIASNASLETMLDRMRALLAAEKSLASLQTVATGKRGKTARKVAA